MPYTIWPSDDYIGLSLARAIRADLRGTRSLSLRGQGG